MMWFQGDTTHAPHKAMSAGHSPSDISPLGQIPLGYFTPGVSSPGFRRPKTFPHTIPRYNYQGKPNLTKQNSTL